MLHIQLLLFNLLLALVFGSIAFIYFSLQEKVKHMAEMLKQKEIQEEKLMRLKTQAELEALQAKVNPHFLFNTLNSIASLISENPAAAESTVEKLSELFRYTLQCTANSTVKLTEELEIVRSYLQIEKIRFGNRLEFEITSDDRLNNIDVPALLIQPLVENSIKHGISPEVQGGTIRVEAKYIDNECLISVIDSGKGFANEVKETSFGLKSIRERLTLLYGNKATLNVFHDGNTHIHISIPFSLRPAMHIRTIIVDDEELARNRLRKLLQKYQSELEIIAEAQNGEDAVKKISALRPEVIFLDVQMPGYDGFEVVRRLRTKPFIIFATAYNEFALKAFEENSVDYLLKPIEQKRLDKAVEKLRRLFDSSKLRLNENIERMLSRLVSPSLQRMKVKIGEKILLLDLSDVVYFEAKDKYTFLHTSDREYMIDETITDLEVKLDKSNFIRIHRAVIVNVKFIRELVKWFAGRYKAKLKDKRETELIVSRRYADQIRHL